MSNTTERQHQAAIVRPARTSDIAQVSALGMRVFTASFGHTVQPHQLEAYLDEAYSLDATAAVLADPDRDLVVAVHPADDKSVLGFALLTRNSTEPCVSHLPDTVELQRIYVDTSCHGKGLGTMLAQFLEVSAREQGFKHMWLGVWEENLGAQKMYSRLGYKPVGVHDFVIGDDVQQDHIMVKALI